MPGLRVTPARLHQAAAQAVAASSVAATRGEGRFIAFSDTSSVPMSCLYFR